MSDGCDWSVWMREVVGVVVGLILQCVVCAVQGADYHSGCLFGFEVFEHVVLEGGDVAVRGGRGEGAAVARTVVEDS